MPYRTPGQVSPDPAPPKGDDRVVPPFEPLNEIAVLYVAGAVLAVLVSAAWWGVLNWPF